MLEHLEGLDLPLVGRVRATCVVEAVDRVHRGGRDRQRRFVADDVSIAMLLYQPACVVRVCFVVDDLGRFGERVLVIAHLLEAR